MNGDISPARKLVYSIALIPMVPAVSIFVVALTTPLTRTSPAALDEFQWFQGAFSLCCVLGAILLWRRLVLWTLGRVWLTALVATIPFVQVAVNLPILQISTGECDPSSEVLRTAQHQVSVGLWIWMTIWCWWAWEKQVTATNVAGPSFLKGAGMSTVAKRILVSLGSIPIIFGVFWVAWVLFDKFGARSGSELWVAYLVAAVVQVPIWISIWKPCVDWDRKVVWNTTLLALGCIFVPIGVVAFLESLQNLRSGEIYEACGFLPVFGWGLWMALSVWMWPGSAFGSRNTSDSLKCLKCGYLLTGLRATRCPECGNEPTLDELWEGHRSDL